MYSHCTSHQDSSKYLQYILKFAGSYWSVLYLYLIGLLWTHDCYDWPSDKWNLIRVSFLSLLSSFTCELLTMFVEVASSRQKHWKSKLCVSTASANRSLRDLWVILLETIFASQHFCILGCSSGWNFNQRFCNDVKNHNIWKRFTVYQCSFANLQISEVCTPHANVNLSFKPYFTWIIAIVHRRSQDKNFERWNLF